MIDAADIQRLHLGHYTMPAPKPEEAARDPERAMEMSRLSGQQIVITGFLIRHPRGPFLFDTGLGTTGWIASPSSITGACSSRTTTRSGNARRSARSRRSQP